MQQSLFATDISVYETRKRWKHYITWRIGLAGVQRAKAIHLANQALYFVSLCLLARPVSPPPPVYVPLLTANRLNLVLPSFNATHHNRPTPACSFL